MNKEAFAAGCALLRRPILPLVSIAHCIFASVPGNRVEEIIAQFPESIETNFACYEQTAKLLQPYLPVLQRLSALKSAIAFSAQVVDEQGQNLHPANALYALVAQEVLERELEEINSLLCASCDCMLCCIGPSKVMRQEYFEIPLSAEEWSRFPVPRFDTDASRRSLPTDEPTLQYQGADFFTQNAPFVAHWRNGWSLMLPRNTRCPMLKANDRCRIYATRPQVCRKPQIFAYLLEPLPTQDTQPLYRLRNSILAVQDCPYVQKLTNEIAAYAAACELECVFCENKA